MDPLALVPYAIAAAGGRTDGVDNSQLVAAGLTLLQRSAPLVRALAGRRSALLLPPGPAWIVALAASDGHGAVLLAPDQGAREQELSAWNVGAVFTISPLSEGLPPGTPHVLLDDAPRRATVVTTDRVQEVDLGSHFALDLVGDMDGPGSPEECVLFAATGHAASHRQVIDAARDAMRSEQFTPVDRTVSTVAPRSLDELALGMLAPLLAGGQLRPLTEHSTNALLRAVRDIDATMIVMPATTNEPLATEGAEHADQLARIKRVVRVSS